jgi:hypothetical protein
VIPVPVSGTSSCWVSRAQNLIETAAPDGAPPRRISAVQSTGQKYFNTYIH